jgi:hypothetical protein
MNKILLVFVLLASWTLHSTSWAQAQPPKPKPILEIREGADVDNVGLRFQMHIDPNGTPHLTRIRFHIQATFVYEITQTNQGQTFRYQTSASGTYAREHTNRGSSAYTTWVNSPYPRPAEVELLHRYTSARLISVHINILDNDRIPFTIGPLNTRLDIGDPTFLDTVSVQAATPLPLNLRPTVLLREDVYAEGHPASEIRVTRPNSSTSFLGLYNRFIPIVEDPFYVLVEYRLRAVTSDNVEIALVVPQLVRVNYITTDLTARGFNAQMSVALSTAGREYDRMIDRVQLRQRYATITLIPTADIWVDPNYNQYVDGPGIQDANPNDNSSTDFTVDGDGMDRGDDNLYEPLNQIIMRGLPPGGGRFFDGGGSTRRLGLYGRRSYGGGLGNRYVELTVQSMTPAVTTYKLDATTFPTTKNSHLETRLFYTRNSMSMWRRAPHAVGTLYSSRLERHDAEVLRGTERTIKMRNIFLSSELDVLHYFVFALAGYEITTVNTYVANAGGMEMIFRNASVRP